MFVHLTCFIFAIVILTGVYSSPVYSNPVAGQSEPTVPAERSVPAASQETCLSQPGKSALAGHRWVYHRKGQRKCWFQTTEQPALKKARSVSFCEGQRCALSRKHQRSSEAEARR